MNAHKGVLSLYISRASFRVFAIQVRMGRSVYSRLPVDNLAKRRGKFLVCRISAAPESITANSRDCVVMEMRYTRRLSFVDQVGMPAGRSPRTTEVGRVLRCLECWPDDSDTGNTGYLSNLGLGINQY